MKKKKMRSALLAIVLFLAFLLKANNGIAQVQKFDLNTFQTEMSIQMQKTFPYMNLDSSLYSILYAASQADAGYPSCYGTHYGAYANITDNVQELALQVVSEYKKFLVDRIFLKEESIRNCYFDRFCCIAEMRGGLLFYEFVIDNGIDVYKVFPKHKH